VERQSDGGETADAGLVAEGVGEDRPQCDADVLDRVMGVDVEVALGLDRQIKAAVLAELGKHVVEEREPSRNRRLPRAIDLQADADRRLFGGALRARSPAHRAPPSAAALGAECALSSVRSLRSLTSAPPAR